VEADQTKPVNKPEASPASQEKAASTKDDPDEVVCISHQETASRIPGKKECHPLRVWDQMTDDARQTLERLQRMTMQHPM